MIYLRTKNWPGYQLIDTGGNEKLERFGQYTIRRPEPQAIWDKALPQAEWDKADAYFRKEKSNDKTSEKGEWILKKNMPGQWWTEYLENGMALKFRLGLTSFKHVGLFPEQAVHWDFIMAESSKREKPKVLNLFAYTGAASLAARAAGADVTHVDSVKQVISWSRENMEASGLDNIRWVVEDALKFVQREVRRANTYQGIILDPPAYGRGPDGEKWLLEDQINEMLGLCAQLLDKNGFLVINLYSLGFSALILENLIKQHFPDRKEYELGELYLQDQSDRNLPLGTFVRI